MLGFFFFFFNMEDANYFFFFQYLFIYSYKHQKLPKYISDYPKIQEKLAENMCMFFFIPTRTYLWLIRTNLNHTQKMHCFICMFFFVKKKIQIFFWKISEQHRLNNLHCAGELGRELCVARYKFDWINRLNLFKYGRPPSQA